MRKIRVLKIGRRLFRVSRWVVSRKRIRSGYQRIGQFQSSAFCKSKTISKLLSWGCRFTSGAKSLCYSKLGSGYVQLGHEPVENNNKAVTVTVTVTMTVPKGHMAVYVGQKEGEFHRVLVPVIYFNHPLFCELLREAEEEYGFEQKGGITIPCRFSEFQKVQTRIAS